MKLASKLGSFLVSISLTALALSLWAAAVYFFLPKKEASETKPPETYGPMQSQSDWNHSRVAMAYVCWTAATSMERVKDSEAFATFIKFIEKHSVSLKSKHSSNVFRAAHSWSQISVDSRENFYSAECTKPAKRIKIAITQGMIEK